MSALRVRGSTTRESGCRARTPDPYASSGDRDRLRVFDTRAGSVRLTTRVKATSPCRGQVMGRPRPEAAGPTVESITGTEREDSWTPWAHTSTCTQKGARGAQQKEGIDRG